MVITKELMPQHYKEFHCLGQKCRDDCCRWWRITFDKKDYLRLRRLNAPEPLKSRVDHAVKRLKGDDVTNKKYAKFQFDESGCCLLLDEDGLCSLQRTCGEDALPDVCKHFPRVKRITPAAVERSLSLGCEAVLQLLWELRDGVDFVEEPLENPFRFLFPVEEKDGDVWEWFPEVRSVCVDILQNRAVPVSTRMVLLGMALQRLAEMDWSNFDLKSWFAYAGVLAGNGAVSLAAPLQGDLKLFLAQNINVALRISQNKPQFADVLRIFNLNIDSAAGSISISLPENMAVYRARREQLSETLGNLDCFFENIMVDALFYLAFPNLFSKESMWKDYVNLCNLYSFYRFSAVAGFNETPTKEALFHILVMVSRSFLHSGKMRKELCDEFFQNESTSLAHMAILVSE